MGDQDPTIRKWIDELADVMNCGWDETEPFAVDENDIPAIPVDRLLKEENGTC